MYIYNYIHIYIIYIHTFMKIQWSGCSYFSSLTLWESNTETEHLSLIPLVSNSKFPNWVTPCHVLCHVLS